MSFDTLFQGMPPSLQADTSISLYKAALDNVSCPLCHTNCIIVCGSKVPLFANTELGFTKLLALSIKPALFLRGEYIVRKGDIGTEVREKKVV